MRLINADALIHELNNSHYPGAPYVDAGISIAIGKICDAPTIEPEIVRCKDCKHQVKEWRADKRLKNKGYMVCGCDVVGDACGYWALLGQDDDYCSYAERRTDIALSLATITDAMTRKDGEADDE